MRQSPESGLSSPMLKFSGTYYKSPAYSKNISDSLRYLENIFIYLSENNDYSSSTYSKKNLFDEVTKLCKITDPDFVFNKLANRYLREIAKRNYSSKELNCGWAFSYEDLIDSETVATQSSFKPEQSNSKIKKINLSFYASLAELFDQEATKALKDIHSQSLLPKKIDRTEIFQKHPILNSNNHNGYLKFRILQLFKKKLADASGAFKEYLENFIEFCPAINPDLPQLASFDSQVYIKDFETSIPLNLSQSSDISYHDLLKKITKLNTELTYIKKGLEPKSKTKNIALFLKSLEPYFTLSSEEYSLLNMKVAPTKPPTHRDPFLDSLQTAQPSKTDTASPNRVKEAKKTYSDIYFRANMAFKEALRNLSSINSQSNDASRQHTKISPTTFFKGNSATGRSLS